MNEKIKNGFKQFKINCIRCHFIRSEGGTIGGELTSELINRHSRNWLQNFIIEPEKFHPYSKMPSFGTTGILALEKIDHILDYLYFIFPVSKNNTNLKEDKSVLLNSELDHASKKIIAKSK